MKSTRAFNVQIKQNRIYITRAVIIAITLYILIKKSKFISQELLLLSLHDISQINKLNFLLKWFSTFP
jgi:hypothetical protein